MAAFAPDLVIADIPYLPIAAAASLDIPVIAVASLSWDHVIAAYFSMTAAEPRRWVDEMAAAYAMTTMALLPEPAIIADTFPVQKHIPPLSLPARADRIRVRSDLGLQESDRRPVVLVSLGGIPANSIPVAALGSDDRFHWILEAPIPQQLQGMSHMHHLSSLPHWQFRDLSASVDGIVSKPGYGMAVASAIDGVPFLYVCRKTFPDEAPIGRWLKNNNRSREMEKTQFASGQWGDAMLRLLEQTPPTPPKPDGAMAAVEEINRVLA